MFEIVEESIQEVDSEAHSIFNMVYKAERWELGLP